MAGQVRPKMKLRLIGREFYDTLDGALRLRTP